MQLSAHCFLDGVVFDPLPPAFPVGDGVAWISNNYEPNKGQGKQEILGSMLHYKATVNPNDFIPPEDNTHDHSIHFKKIGELSDKYRGIMSEAATMVEGLVSISALKPFPPFRVQQVMINLSADTAQDQEMLKKDLISSFGDIGVSRDKSNIVVGGAHERFALIEKVGERLSALAIYTTGARSEERFEMEIAFSSFFRVIEGYLGDGTQHVEAALHKKEAELSALLNLSGEALTALHTILKSLSLPISSQDLADGKGIISDIVLLRHKLMHYNLKNQDRHFYAALKVDLKPVVHHMHRAAFFLIKEDIDPPKAEEA